jgi:hypothetical protein
MPRPQFSPSATSVEANDFLEIRIACDALPVNNPFTDVEVRGTFARENQAPVEVAGFCDSADGTLFKLRFLPTQAGTYHYTISLSAGGETYTHQSTCDVVESRRKGLLRVDKEHPWHFVWQGSGEHYFWNGTTTYFLLGLDDDWMLQSVERLANLRVNRLRVALSGRVENGTTWFEPVFPTERFRFTLNPWLAQNPDSVSEPGFDVTRFNLPFWHKLEKLLHFAREHDVIISVLFYVDGARPGTDPFKENCGGADEQRYYHYAASRLSAFSNLTWDVTNEYRLFRDDAWAEKMGTFLKECDPYDHLTSVHGHGDFRFPTAPLGRLRPVSSMGRRWRTWFHVA